MAGKIVALDQQYLQPEQRGFARDRAAVDAAADDEKVVSHRLHVPQPPVLTSCGAGPILYPAFSKCHIADGWTRGAGTSHRKSSGARH